MTKWQIALLQASLTQALMDIGLDDLTVGRAVDAIANDGFLLEIDRNARAYGWEIGNGQTIARQIDVTEGNPFTGTAWRNIP